jgi:DNA-binding transcriptional LysR family regulator
VGEGFIFQHQTLTRPFRGEREQDPNLTTRGVPLQHTVTVTQLATVMSFVRAGLGVAIVPAGAIAAFNTDGLKHLDAHTLGLVDKSKLMRLKE